jgi:putative ABC transport system permease protein
MIRNYFIVALRNISRNRLMSSLNILGLAIGLSAALVIYLIVRHQLSYDKDYSAQNRMYRVVTHLRFAETNFKNGGVPAPLGAVIKKEVTGIEKATRAYSVMWNARVSVPRSGSSDMVVFKDRSNISFVDEDYLHIFDKKLLAGTAKGMDQTPNLVVLTASRAKLYFPRLDYSEMPGSILYYNDTVQVKVAGIIADHQNPTDLKHFELLSIPTIKSAGLSGNADETQWGSVNSNCQLFITLTEGTRPEKVTQQLKAILSKYKKPEPGVDPEKNFTRFILQPVGAMHFDRDFGGPADKKSLNGLMMLAGFLMLLGCINFINLSTAQAAKRAKEIGIRKTIGSTRKQLVIQFLTETFVLTLIAVMFAVAMTPLLLRIFNDYVPEGLTFDQVAWQKIALFAPCLLLVVTFLAGFYPALVLSGFKPVLVLKNQAFTNTGQSRTAWLRKSLTVSQFIIAQFFVIATIVVGRQIDYSLNMDMGFNRDNIVSFDIPFDEVKTTGKVAALRNELSALPGIDRITTGAQPAMSGSMSSTFKIIKGDQETEVQIQTRTGDSAYIDLFGIRLLAGRNLRSTDTGRAMLINESFAREIGYTNVAGAVGQFVAQDNEKVEVIGVVKDFNLSSARSGILPTAIRYQKYVGEINLKLHPETTVGTQKATIARIKDVYQSIYPDRTFVISYFDERINNFYTNEMKMSSLLRWAAGLSIFISCLGLLGLAIYTANQRRKEIGIRKVLGASVTQIVNLLSKDFLVLVLIACIIAVPVAWWACNSWLQDFPYRAPLSGWIFVTGSCILLSIAFLILSIKTINSASASPVNSLRSE